jgi:hypothetical protein
VPTLGVNLKTAADIAGLSPADLDLLIRLHQADLWEARAGAAAQYNAGTDQIRQLGTRITGEDHDLDQAVHNVAVQVGVQLPEEPTADQQSWLRELDAARRGEFDRAFVDRLRTADGIVFPLIANVRAGSRNELIRAFASTANSYVLRHLSYLQSTDQVSYALLPADRDLIIRLRQADLWMLAASATAEQRSTDSTVRQAASLIGAALSNQDRAVRSVATQLGMALPDSPTAEQVRWSSRINTARGTNLDRVFVSQVRAAAGTDLVAIANARVDTRNPLVRTLATTASDTAIRSMTTLENTGLVDYGAMPQETRPPRITNLDHGGSPPGYLLWLILAAAAAAAVATAALHRLAQPRRSTQTTNISPHPTLERR